jgi:ABC-type glycerol-3-phosphate transport system substrate-binding protein
LSSRHLRRRAAPVLLLAAALTATACAADTGHRTDLRLYNDKAAWTPFFKQLSEQSERQIGVQMTPAGYADAPTYQAFVKSSLRTKVRPDLFTWATGPQLAGLVAGGNVGETTGLWKKAVAAGDLPESLKTYYTVKGRQYCVPQNVSYWVMFYNKKVFAKAGVQPPSTWAELMRLAAKVKAAGSTPFYQTNVLFSFAWFQALVAGADPEFYNRLTHGRASYTDPVVSKAMKTWKHMMDKGWMTDPGLKVDPAALLKSGKAAMVPIGTWFNTSMIQAGMKPGKDYGMFVIPSVDPELDKTPVPTESGALCQPARPYDKATGTKLLTWWTTAKAQTTWANSRGDVSANPKVKIPDPAMGKIAKDAGSDRYLLVNRYYDAVDPGVLTAALDAFGGFMAKPASYPQQLARLQRTAEAVAAAAAKSPKGGSK